MSLSYFLVYRLNYKNVLIGEVLLCFSILSNHLTFYLTVRVEISSSSARPTLNVHGTSTNASRSVTSTTAPQRGRAREIPPEGNSAARQPTTPPAGAFLILSQVWRKILLNLI